MELRGQMLGHHPAKRRCGALQILAKDEVEWRFDARLGPPGDPGRHHRGHVRQRPHADGCGRNTGFGQGLSDRIDVARAQGANGCNRQLLGQVVVHQPNGVAAAGVEQINQRLVDVDEDDFVARLGEKLSNKTPANVAGAENN